jgi:multicomponent Na+:H+ antiporter subunit E
MRSVATIATRALLAAAGWWAISEGRTSLWPWGVVAVCAAVSLSLLLSPPGRGTGLRPVAALRFAAAFLGGSSRGALDVASRAVRPGPPIAPGFLKYRLRLPPGPPRHLFAATVSLLPGTLSTRLEGGVLTVHVLDLGLPVAETLERVEARVAAVFGEPL